MSDAQIGRLLSACLDDACKIGDAIAVASPALAEFVRAARVLRAELRGEGEPCEKPRER